MATSLAGGSKGGSGMDGLDLGGLVKNLSDTLGNLDIPPPDNFSSFNDNTDNVESTDSANETQTQENDNNNNSNNTRPILIKERFTIYHIYIFFHFFYSY